MTERIYPFHCRSKKAFRNHGFEQIKVHRIILVFDIAASRNCVAPRVSKDIRPFCIINVQRCRYFMLSHLGVQF